MQFNKKETIEVIGEVELEGRIRIFVWLYQHDLPFLPEEFNWKWEDRTGRLTKRISAWLFKNHKIKLTAQEINEIGNIAGKYKVPSAEYTYDFDNSMDWSAGQFGDDGSCFWGSNASARDIMRKNEFFAIRFFRKEPGSREGKFRYRGIGRAWIAPDHPVAGCYVVFNAYGPLNLRQVATIFAGLTGNVDASGNPYIKAIDLSNEIKSALYINGDVGMAIGAYSMAFESHDFNVSLVTKTECDSCGAAYSEDDLYSTEDGLVCYACLQRYYKMCAACNEYHHQGNTKLIRWRNIERGYADNGIEVQLFPNTYNVHIGINCEHRVHECEVCGVNASRLYTGFDGQQVCYNCYASVNACTCCNYHQYNINMLRIGTYRSYQYVCRDCFDHHTHYCKRCDTLYVGEKCPRSWDHEYYSESDIIEKPVAVGNVTLPARRIRLNVAQRTQIANIMETVRQTIREQE